MNRMDTSNFNKALFFILAAVALGLSACTTTEQVTGAPKVPKKAKVANSDKAMIHTKLARGYMQQNQYATAKGELEKALSFDSRHSPANYVMALLMIKLEQFDNAEKYFARSVSANRENSSAAHDFGVFLCQIGKPEKAVPNFEIAVSNPLFKQAELSYMRAGECLAEKDPVRAEQFLTKALSLNPRLGPALLRLATLKYNANNYLSARAYVERYFAITEPQPDSLLLAYKIESSLNAKSVANGYRTKLLNSFPGSKEARSIREYDR